MKIGILWYDDDARRELDEKVARAVAYVQATYGVIPSVCFANPAMLSGESETAGGVEVRPDPTLMLYHFWFGVGDVSARFDYDAVLFGRSLGSE